MGQRGHIACPDGAARRALETTGAPQAWGHLAAGRVLGLLKKGAISRASRRTDRLFRGGEARRCPWLQDLPGSVKTHPFQKMKSLDPPGTWVSKGHFPQGPSKIKIPQGFSDQAERFGLYLVGKWGPPRGGKSPGLHWGELVGAAGSWHPSARPRPHLCDGLRAIPSVPTLFWKSGSTCPPSRICVRVDSSATQSGCPARGPGVGVLRPAR